MPSILNSSRRAHSRRGRLKFSIPVGCSKTGASLLLLLFIRAVDYLARVADPAPCVVGNRQPFAVGEVFLAFDAVRVELRLVGHAVVERASQVFRDAPLQVLHLHDDLRVALGLLEQLAVDDELRLGEGHDGQLRFDHFRNVPDQQVVVDLIPVQLLVHRRSLAPPVHQHMVAALLVHADVAHHVVFSALLFTLPL